jgi:predicted phage-related endonuclease
MVQEAARQVRVLAANWSDNDNPEHLLAQIEHLARNMGIKRKVYMTIWP